MPIEKKEIIIYIILMGAIFLTVLVFIFIFFLIFKKKQLKNRIEKNQIFYSHQQEILQTQIEIQEQTLKNISEEIHDNIGQVLSLVKLNLNTFPVNLEEPVQKKIQDTELLLSKAIDDLRDLSQSMNTDKIASIGLEAALQQELRQLQKTGRFNTGLQVTGSRYSLPPQKEMVLFRMVQEALNNAVKHSGAKDIIIQLKYSPALFIMHISDNGKGFNPEMNHPSKTGLGLKNMHNRAALIGAIFSVHSSLNNGATLSIELQTTVP